MALTIEDRNEILALHGQHYSYRKIADKTDHSETTIRKVINTTKQQLGPLLAQGLTAKEIAKQTDYPIEFIRRVKETGIKEPDEKKKEEEAEEKTDKKAIENEWNTLLKTQDVERLKIRLRRRINNHIGRIEELESKLEKENLIGLNWEDPKRVILERLGFVMKRSISANEAKEIQELENLSDEEEKEVNKLLREHETKFNQRQKERAQQRKKVSDDLLDEWLDSPAFPDDIKGQIKELITVQNESQARTVCRAFFQRAIPLMFSNNEKTPVADEFWKSFISEVRNRRWSFIKEMEKITLECYGDLTA